MLSMQLVQDMLTRFGPLHLGAALGVVHLPRLVGLALRDPHTHE